MTLFTELSEQTVERLQDLLRINLDSAKGLKEAADVVEYDTLATLFREFAHERATFAEQLKQHVQGQGEEPVESGSIKAAIHRWWIDLRAKIQDGDAHAVLAEAERGEDEIKQLYEDVLPELSASPIQAVVKQQYDRVKIGHDRIRDLRDAMKDAKS